MKKFLSVLIIFIITTNISYGANDNFTNAIKKVFLKKKIEKNINVRTIKSTTIESGMACSPEQAEKSCGNKEK